MNSRTLHLNMAQPRTYEDAFILAAVELVGSVLYDAAPPLLVALGLATLLWLVHRLNETQNTSKIRKLALAVFVTWAVWLLWGVSLGATRWPRLALVASVGLIGGGVYVAVHERAHFEPLDARGTAAAAALIFLGILPLNPAHTVPLAARILQSLLHCAVSFALFARLMPLQPLSGTPLLYCVSTLWVLTAWYPLALAAAPAAFVYYVYGFLRHVESDPEAPPPPPLPVPPRPAAKVAVAPLGEQLRLSLMRHVHNTVNTEFRERLSEVPRQRLIDPTVLDDDDIDN